MKKKYTKRPPKPCTDPIILKLRVMNKHNLLPPAPIWLKDKSTIPEVNLLKAIFIQAWDDYFSIHPHLHYSDHSILLTTNVKKDFLRAKMFLDMFEEDKVEFYKQVKEAA